MTDRTTYATLKRGLAPRLRFNQSIYEDIVSTYVRSGITWLDAGCGKHIFPSWREDAERAVVGRARFVLGCDVDEPSLRGHRTVSRLCLGDLEALPLRTESIDLVTCNMVVEHLREPFKVFREFSRVLRPGGRILLHTPNAYSYFVLGSRFIPRPLKLKLVARLDGRTPDDVFPTRYRANTRRRIRSLMGGAGLQEEWHRMLASDAVFWEAHPALAALELLWIRLTLARPCRALRATIVGSYVKGA